MSDEQPDDVIRQAEDRWQRAAQAMEEFEWRYDSLSGHWDKYYALQRELSSAAFALRQARDQARDRA